MTNVSNFPSEYCRNIIQFFLEKATFCIALLKKIINFYFSTAEKGQLSRTLILTSLKNLLGKSKILCAQTAIFDSIFSLSKIVSTFEKREQKSEPNCTMACILQSRNSQSHKYSECNGGYPNTYLSLHKNKSRPLNYRNLKDTK